MHLRHPSFGLVLLSLLAGPTLAQERPTLTVEDKKYLDGLTGEFLFDPKGSERVSVKVVLRSVWGTAEDAAADGWWMAGAGGKPGRVYFTDGAWVPAPPEREMKKVDFLAESTTRYPEPPKQAEGDKKGEVKPREVFDRMGRTALGILVDDDLAYAVWLYRLGHEELAARALALARKGMGNPRQNLRDGLAWSAFAKMVHAYMVRADEEALAHGERLLRLYAAESKRQEFRQGAQLVEELKRRQKRGTFGKAPPPQWPDGFEKWDAAKKAAYLIDALEEVGARQDGQPGGVNLAADRRVEALIRLGDAAVPALIDVLEKDERLTRSVHFWRDFARSRTVLSVREAALTALMSILRVRAFTPRSTGDNFTAGGDEAAKETAKRLRDYWNTYGGLPFDERMMKVLTNPQAKFEAKREAALNLVTLSQDRRLGTTVWTDSSGPRPDRKPNPAAAKFSKPSAAEAILAALDADLQKHWNAGDYALRRIFETYLGALVELGDKRVALALTRRLGTAETHYERRQWAQAAESLGDPKPFASFADDVRAGKIPLTPGEPGERELKNIVATLVSADIPEADRALHALADRKHPGHRVVAAQLLKERVEWTDSTPWFTHPYCLRILRAALEDTTPTEAKLWIEKGALLRAEKGARSSSPLPAFLAAATAHRQEAAERVCDAAGVNLPTLVVGLPLYHPLLKEADQRLQAVQAGFDRFAGSYRRASRRELEILGFHRWTVTYVPDIRSLGRAASADDVKAGKAIFHLDGKGKPADVKLPAAAVLKRDEKHAQPPRLLIVQAEIGPDGEAVYGVLTRHEVRTLSARETSLLSSDE